MGLLAEGNMLPARMWCMHPLPHLPCSLVVCTLHPLYISHAYTHTMQVYYQSLVAGNTEGASEAVFNW